MHKKRVVVTGLGMVSPAGSNTNENWQSVLEGYSRAKKVEKFSIGEMPCQLAYEIENFQLHDESKTLFEDQPEAKGAFAHFGVNAAVEAMKQSKLVPGSDVAKKMGIVMGNGMGSPTFDWFSRIYVDERFEDERLAESFQNRPERLSQLLKKLTGSEGPNKTVHTACASSGQALGEAFEMIAGGESSMILTGGADSMINPFHMAGFCLLGALSNRNDDPKTASRPFDENRDGFVLGEGACVLVFEELNHALERGADIIAEVCGYGITESAYRITDLHPEGRGPKEAMEMAVTDSGIKPEQVGYVNAHGTSTSLNDRIESLSIEKLFGDHTFVSSTKSVTGHMISAAGAIEFGFALLSLRDQLLPPSTNLFNQDPQCSIKTTPTKPESAKFNYALSNSVGFGGSNTALVAGRFQA